MCLMCGQPATWISPTGHHFCDRDRQTYQDLYPTSFGKLYTRSDLAGIEPPDTTFGPYIVSGGVNMLYGKWGTAKSFLVLSWAASLTTGVAWNGYTTQPANVIFWAAEGLNGLHHRFEAWEQHHNTVVPDDRLHVPAKSPSLDNEVTYTALAQIVEETQANHLIIDTLIRVKGTLRENEADELGGYLLTELAHRISDHYSCSITLVHHVGHEVKDRPRGSSSITDNLDGLYEIRDAGAGLYTLHVRKLKDQSMDGPPDKFHLIPVASSVVLAPTNAVLLTDQQSDIYQILARLSPEGQWVRSTDLATHAGVNRNRIQEALRKLVGSQVDYREGKGRPSEYRLVRGAQQSPLEVPESATGHPLDDMPDTF